MELSGLGACPGPRSGVHRSDDFCEAVKLQLTNYSMSGKIRTVQGHYGSG